MKIVFFLFVLFRLLFRFNAYAGRREDDRMVGGHTIRALESIYVHLKSSNVFRGVNNSFSMNNPFFEIKQPLTDSLYPLHQSGIDILSGKKSMRARYTFTSRKLQTDESIMMYRAPTQRAHGKMVENDASEESARDNLRGGC